MVLDLGSRKVVNLQNVNTERSCSSRERTRPLLRQLPMKTSTAMDAGASTQDGGAGAKGAPSSTSDKTKSTPLGNYVPVTQGWDADDREFAVVMAELLETIRVQLVIIMAIAMDVVFAAAELYLQNQLELARYQSVRVGEDSVPVQTMRMALRVINSCTGFTTMFFLLELIVLACAFRLQFIRHIGYVLDLILVSSSWIHELSTQSKLLRLLGLLRLWRVFRLVHSLVERERREHDVTRQLLENEKKVVMNLRVEKDAAQQTLGKEYESRAALEVLLQGYKDEIDTMKEALSIAAQAVAAAELRDGAFEDTSMGDYYAHDSEVTKAAAQNNDDAIVHGELDTPEQVSSIKQAPLKDATSTHKATEPSLANPEVDDEGFEDAMEA